MKTVLAPLSLGLGILLAQSTLAAQPPVVSTTGVSGVTLAQCYAQAQHVSETLGISEENMRLVEAQYQTQLGAVLPHLSFIKQQFFQEPVEASNNGSGGVSGSFLKSTQPSSYFRLQQPIFSGFRDWAALAGAKSVRIQARYAAAAADEQVLSDVASAFYAALTLDQQLTVLAETRKVTSDRIAQLTHWVNIGRSRQSEVLNGQYQLATLDAQIEDKKRSQAEAHELLHYLTGIPPETPLVDDLRDENPPSSEEALARAARRPDVMAAVEALSQAGYALRYAKGGYWPDLSLTANYYIERFGFQSNVRWDATFLLNVPIYAGGTTKSVIAAARSQEVIAQLALNRLHRQVEQQVQTALADVRYSLSQAAAYGAAADLAERNYRAQEKEYRLGLVTNLELLQLLSSLQDTKSQWLQSKSAAKLNTVRLRVALGEGL